MYLSPSACQAQKNVLFTLCPLTDSTVEVHTHLVFQIRNFRGNKQLSPCQQTYEQQGRLRPGATEFPSLYPFFPASRVHKCLPVGRRSLGCGGLKREESLGSLPALTNQLLQQPHSERHRVPVLLGHGLRIGSPRCFLPNNIHLHPCLIAQGSSLICSVDHTHYPPAVFHPPRPFPHYHKASHLETQGYSGQPLPRPPGRILLPFSSLHFISGH